jgi:hypothetical protein
MASLELEALVGHLFVVGGRAISSPSPGAIAMPPPRRAARGRDADTLFGLLALGEGQRQPASFYEGLVTAFSDKYFKVSGGVTTALRDSIREVNAEILKVNSRRPDPFEVGIACAVLRGQELYIAVAGPARCFLVREGFVERLPDDDDLREGIASLGMEKDADVRLFRRDVRAGDFLIVTDASLDHLGDTTIRHALESGEVDATLVNLRSVAGEFTSAIVIKFVAPLEEGEIDDLPARPVPSAPPLRSFEPPEAQPAPSPTPAAPVEGDEGELAEGEAAEGEAPPEKVLPWPRRLARNLTLGLAKATDGTRTLVTSMMPGEEEEGAPMGRFQLSTTMQIGVAVAVAVLVALVTTAVYRFRGQTSQYAQLVREAQAEIEQARAGADDQATARPHWESAIFLLDQAAEIRSPGAEIWSLRSEALAVLDSYDHISRVTPVLMREYPEGAVLRGPVVQGLNLYVVDETQDILYREDLDENGTRFVNREPQIITRQGDVVGSQVIGGMVDLTWMEEGGVPQRNVLAVITRNGLLITYSPSWDVTATPLPDYEAWQEPRAIAVYEGDLYILDAGASEIWRYPASADSYSSTPQRYLTDIEADLSDAIDMAIDTNGNVYILHASGRISKFFQGRPEVFQFEGLPQPLSRPAAFHLSLSLFDRTLFIADPGGGRLVASALTGAFLANYKDADDAVFDSLSGVFSVDRPPVVYLAAGSRLYNFSP